MIYLDSHATTPVDPRVLKAMLPYFTERSGNAASLTHAAGRQASAAVEKARAEVAALIGADPKEIVFTSGATESNNLALKGAAEAYRDKGDHLITIATEHKSVLDPVKRLGLSGFRVTVLGVGKDGLVDPAAVEAALTPETTLVSVMLANNEIGVIQPVAAIGRMLKKRGIVFHCDASQAAGKIPVNVRTLGVDLLSFTAHKLYGPKGVGALYVRKSEPRVRLIPQMDGGGHEGGFRSGTLNVPAIVGFGKACVLSAKTMRVEALRTARLRDHLQKELLEGVEGCSVNGSLKFRLPHNLNVSFEGIRSAELLKRLHGIAISAGSACVSSSPEPSHVLREIGVPDDLRAGSVRFGLGRFTTESEVRRAARETLKAVRYLRNMRNRSA